MYIVFCHLWLFISYHPEKNKISENTEESLSSWQSCIWPITRSLAVWSCSYFCHGRTSEQTYWHKPRGLRDPGASFSADFYSFDYKETQDYHKYTPFTLDKESTNTYSWLLSLPVACCLCLAFVFCHVQHSTEMRKKCQLDLVWCGVWSAASTVSCSAWCIRDDECDTKKKAESPQGVLRPFFNGFTDIHTTCIYALI